jgi:hypothetical protein
MRSRGNMTIREFFENMASLGDTSLLDLQVKDFALGLLFIACGIFILAKGVSYIATVMTLAFATFFCTPVWIVCIAYWAFVKR